MNQTNNRIREEKVVEHQTWIRENLWCKKHIFPRVDIACDECRKLIPLREKCDASFVNSLDFIDSLLKIQREEIQKDLDDGKFYSICSNETTFKNYVFELLKLQREEMIEKIEKLSVFADSGDTLKSRIINLIKE